MNVEEAAEEKEYVKDLLGLTVRHVDVPLLEKQEEYFVYVDQLLGWVNYEGRVRNEKLKSNPLEKPATLPVPARHL